MHGVTGPPAGRVEGAGDDIRPVREIALGVADDRRAARGAAGGMETAHLLLGDGEHPEGVLGAQIVLDGEREAGEVAERAAVPRMHPGPVEGLPVERDVVIGVLQRGAQPCQLQGVQRLRGESFRIVELSLPVAASGMEFTASCPYRSFGSRMLVQVISARRTRQGAWRRHLPGSVQRMSDVRKVQVGEVQLAYRVWGEEDAPPALLLHCLGEDGEDWRGGSPARRDSPCLRPRPAGPRVQRLARCVRLRTVAGRRDRASCRRSAWSG